MKTLKNPDGYSAIHALLILVILGIVGFTGWYVWNANQRTDTSLDRNGRDVSKSENKSVEQKSTKDFSFSDPQFSFSYPKSWIVEDTTRDAAADDSAWKAYVTFSSPDYRIDEANDFLKVLNGGRITVYVRQVDVSKLEDLEDIQTSGENISSIKLDGVAAVRNDNLGGEVKNSTSVYAVKDRLLYTIWYLHSDKESNSNAKYLKEYNEIITTFKFR